MPDKPFDYACWIWDEGDPRPINAHRYFRKAFVVPEHWPSHPVLRIAASTRYKLYINGSWMAAGPAPSARGTISYDEYVLSLSPGDQVCVSVIVEYVGVPMLSHQNTRAGLIVEIEEIVSDATWRVATMSAYVSHSRRLTPEQGFSDQYNGSLTPQGFTAYDGDWQLEPRYARQWMRAVVVEKAYGPTWPVMLPTMRSQGKAAAVRHEEESSARLIEYGNCQRGAGNNPAERATSDICLPLTTGSVEAGNFDYGFGYKVVADRADIALTFDSGREVSGYPLIAYRYNDVQDDREAYIDVVYDEALRPAETPSGFRADGGSQGLHYADQIILNRGATYEYISSTPRAFRYLRLIIRNASGNIIIEQPLLVAPHGDWFAGLGTRSENKGENVLADHIDSVFTCSDPRLESIFKTGKRTLALCLDDQLNDTPMRGRAQWIADARIEAIGVCYAFGDSALHARFLRQAALSQHADGRLDPVGPGEWDALNPNTPIPGYVAIYILSVLDYFQLTGDGDLVREVMPAVLKALAWLGSYGGGEGGLLVDLPGWNFTDWAPGLDQGTDGINAAVNLFYLMALQAASRLAELGGDEAASRSHGLRANMVAAAFDSLFWNPLRGVYVDSVIGGEPSQLASQQVNSLALLAEVGGEARRISIADHLLADSTLTQTGTPYFGYYLTQALASVGREAEALHYIRERWGAMLDAGATSWWKTWDGLQSRCHGWSIGPTIWLPQHILGITAREPGFATVDFAPKLCGLTWAKGIVPIPHGDIQVSWLQKGQKLTVDITVPTGVLLRPILPCAPTDEILIDGQSAREDQIVQRTPTTAEIAVLPGSGYRFVITGSVSA